MNTFIRKIQFIIIALLVSSLYGHAQVNITLLQPAPGQAALYNLFTFQVVNSGGTTFKAHIRGTLTLNNIQDVYTVHYRTVDIPPGVTFFNGSNLSREQEYFGENQQSNTLRSTGLLPSDNYVGCITLNDVSNGSEQGKMCLEYAAASYSPPELLSPFNEETIETTYPVLTWLPPSPILDPGLLKYELSLSEIFSGQAASDALLRNTVLFHKTGISSNTLLYPFDAIPLAVGKSYAWQVVAAFNGQVIGATEIWSFNISTQKQDTLIKKETAQSYVKLKKVLDGSYTPVTKNLKFVYEEYYGDGQLNYRITDLDGKDFTPRDIPLEFHKGDNRYTIPLKNAKLKNNTYYILEVQTPKKDRRVMLFKYFRSENTLKNTKL